MNIYVGNLSYESTEDKIRDLFFFFCEVESCSVIMDRVTGRSRGFGFVEMADDEAAQKAIDELNGKDLDGRALKVNQAKERSGGGGFRRGGGGGGRGRGPRSW